MPIRQNNPLAQQAHLKLYPLLQSPKASKKARVIEPSRADTFESFLQRQEGSEGLAIEKSSLQ